MSYLKEFVISVHSFIKFSINTIGFKKTVDNLHYKIIPNMALKKRNISNKKINDIYNSLSNLSFSGDIVGSCLSFSLAVHFILVSFGCGNSKMQIGVRVIDGKFFSHSWVIYNGKVIGKQFGNIDYLVIKEIDLSKTL